MRVQVMLGDRSQEATMKRLQYYTRHLTRQDSTRQVGWLADWRCRDGSRPLHAWTLQQMGPTFV